MPGRSIRLFLADGTPQGMRTAEVGNWTGLALVCPRTDLARFAARGEVHRTGVLKGTDPTRTCGGPDSVLASDDEAPAVHLVRDPCRTRSPRQ
jgi:hypothetical protein